MNWIFMMLIWQICTNSARVYTWSKKMESKVGIISHRPCKTKPSLWDIGTKQKTNKKHIRISPSTATAERSISLLTRVTLWLERLSSLTLLHIHRDIQLPLDAVVDKFNNTRQIKLLKIARLCVNTHYIINMIKGY